MLGYSARLPDEYSVLMSAVVEIINLQSKGSKAKAYQVKQVRNILVKYRLGEPNVD